MSLNIVEEMLRREFTKDEVVELAHEQASQLQALNRYERELDQIKQSYKAKTTEAENAIGLCTTKIQSGYEMVNTECMVLKFRPTKDEKLTVRLDTGIIVRQAPLNEAERQLTLSTDAPESYEWVVGLAYEDGQVIDVLMTEAEAARVRELPFVTTRPVPRQLGEAIEG